MKQFRLVVDTNIIISALLKDSFTRKLLLSGKLPELSAPVFILEELNKYLDHISKKLDVSKESIRKLLAEFFDAVPIQVISQDQYSSYLKSAQQISPDFKDAPYLALAMFLECAVWSQDRALKNQTQVKVYSTTELLQLCEKLDTSLFSEKALSKDWLSKADELAWKNL